MITIHIVSLFIIIKIIKILLFSLSLFQLQRNILATNPRVTRFKINWDDDNKRLNNLNQLSLQSQPNSQGSTAVNANIIVFVLYYCFVLSCILPHGFVLYCIELYHTTSIVATTINSSPPSSHPLHSTTCSGSRQQGCHGGSVGGLTTQRLPPRISHQQLPC